VWRALATSARAKKTRGAITAPPAPAGFLAAWSEMLWPRPLPDVGRRRGRKPRVPLAQLLPALRYRVVQDTGTLAAHLFALFGTALADSSWSDRRQRLPWEIFATLMRRALRARATRRRHPTAFWRGWRVLALDGTPCSLVNTPGVLATRAKARSRRGRAAFAKLTTAVLLEVGLHHPVAAAIGRAGESEWALGQRLLAQLPTGAVLLGDRLYGVSAFVQLAHTACARVGSHVVLRASRTVQPRTLRRLADGTRLVRLRVRAPQAPPRVVTTVDVREIRVRVGRPWHRAHELRLWTSLLTPRTAPALELARLYATRWQHELYFRDMKRTLRRTDVLQSDTVETGAQEIAAIVLASAVLALERSKAATPTLPALRVSFAQLLQIVRGVWLFAGPFQDLVTEEQQRQILRRAYALMRQSLTDPPRPRSCARAVRQPVTRWPRMLEPTSVERPWRLTVI
jgi:hypothetical protein